MTTTIKWQVNKSTTSHGYLIFCGENTRFTFLANFKYTMVVV